MMARLRGMFAFALTIRQRQRGSLFIARDYFGIKPLYYFHKKDGKLWLLLRK